MPDAAVLTLEAFHEEGRRRFGDDMMTWRFVCPSCGHVASAQEWKQAGAPESAVAFSCVGRWAGGDEAATFRRAGGPCTYAGGGLLALNPVSVQPERGAVYRVFAFADAVSGAHQALPPVGSP